MSQQIVGLYIARLDLKVMLVVYIDWNVTDHPVREVVCLKRTFHTRKMPS